MAKLIGRSAITGKFIEREGRKNSAPGKSLAASSLSGEFVRKSDRSPPKGMYEILGPDGVKRTRISENVIQNAIRDSARKR